MNRDVIDILFWIELLIGGLIVSHRTFRSRLKYFESYSKMSQAEHRQSQYRWFR
jgi:hypothetical protein